MAQAQENNDRIVYSVVTQGGGVDGLDHTDKAKVKFCSFDKTEAQSNITNWDQKDLKADIVDVVKARKEALRKLSPLDKLVLGL